MRLFLLLHLSLFFISNITAQEKQLILQLNHEFSFMDVVYSPDGKFIATASMDGVRIWTSTNHRILRKFNHFNINHSHISSLVYTNDSKFLLSYNDVTLKLWEVATGKLVMEKEDENIQGFNFLPNQKHIALGYRDSTKIIDIQHQKTLKIIPIGSITSPQFTTDGKSMVILPRAFKQKKIYIWNTSSNKVDTIFTPHKTNITKVDISTDNQSILTGDSHGTIKVWDISSQKLQATLEQKGRWIKQITFDSNNQHIVFLVNDRKRHKTNILVWDWKNDIIKDALEGKNIYSFSITPNKRTILLAGLSGIQKWDLSTLEVSSHYEKFNAYNTFTISEQRIITNATHSWNLNDTFSLEKRRHSSPFGGYAYSEKREYSIQKKNPFDFENHTFSLYDIKKEKFRYECKFHKNHISAIKFTPDDKYFISLDHSNQIAIWKTETGQLLHSIKHPKRHYINEEIAISPDNNLFGISNDKYIYIYNIKTGKSVKRIKAKALFLSNLSFSVDSKKIIGMSTFYDEKTYLSIWDINTKKQINSFYISNDITCFITIFKSSINSQSLMASSDKKYLSIWDMDKGTLIQQIDPISEVATSQFSPNGKLLITSHFGGILNFWDVKKGLLKMTIAIIKDDYGNLSYLVFTPDGKYDGDADYFHLLTYTQGTQILPLPPNDINYTPNLFDKIWRIYK